MEQEEHFFTCPYCWSQISILIDLSVDRQEFVEDCEVCCRPIDIFYEVAEDSVTAFGANRAQ
jgi:hypothetical protein